MLHILLFQLLTLAAPAGNSDVTSEKQQAVNIPPEVYNVLRDQYPTADLKIKVKNEDVTVTIRGEGRTQELKMGVTQETLDLATYIDSNWKEFSVSFQAPFPIEGDTQLFFINRYKPITEGDKGGLPCGKALKIKSKLGKLFSTQGIKLMTKGNQYLNLIGGDFLLTQLEGQQFRIAYFKIIDSRASQRLCRQKF